MSFLFKDVPEQELAALARLSTEEFRGFRAFLQRTSHRYQRALVAADDTSSMQRLQGKARAVEEIASVIDAAPGVLEKLRTHGSPPRSRQ